MFFGVIVVFSFNELFGTWKRRSSKNLRRLDWGCARCFRCTVATLLLAVPITVAQVVTYEGNVFPDKEGWTRSLAGTPGAERRIVDGWLVQTARLPAGWSGPTGEADFYRISLDEFAGTEGFFVEWRVVTDNPPWLLDLSQVPAALSASGNSSTYHTTVTDGAVQIFRRTFIPLVIVSVNPGVAHVYRVEVHGAESFAWYIDGEVVESGVPLAFYPDPTAVLVWGVRRSYVDATTAWDYIRFGLIPDDGSGDFDSDGVVSSFDYYFFHDCLTKDGPGIYGGPNRNAGPGCRFADFDGNHSVDLLDFAEFQNLFGPSHP